MYRDVKVLDVHAHPRATAASDAFLARILGVNAPATPPLAGGSSRQPGLTDDDFREAIEPHVRYMDQLSIDVPLLGPGPTRWMGFIEPHLIPTWTQHVNDTIHKQVELFPDRFVGAGQVPLISEAWRTPATAWTRWIAACPTTVSWRCTRVRIRRVGGLYFQPRCTSPTGFRCTTNARPCGLPIVVHGF